jgi:xanthine dehydrogenase YagT iron-sulfur-binding subunit
MKPVDQHTASGVSAPAGVSRRAFLRGLGTVAVTAATTGTSAVAAEMEKANTERVLGPGKVAVAFTVNGASKRVEVEPRVTLLDVLRNHLGLTGTKEGCDRSACGACTVLLNDDPVYACSTLAVEAEGASITTIEGLADSMGELTQIQKSLVAHDGLQCGFCTPGFAMTLTALMRRNPHPSEAEIRLACSGNLCRCGSHPHIVKAALSATGTATTSTTEVIRLDHV